ncbi:MAG TPA: hypothetical protein VN848_08055 [Gemmatimonadales bacterium]|nr:hypothetical protein [Gemmatimonadales bacterium]
MRRTLLVLCAFLVTTSGCNRVKPLTHGLSGVTTGVSAWFAALLGRFHKPAPPPFVPVHHIVKPAPPPPPTPVAAASAAAHVNRDAPYVSQDTGTLTPGMSERDVYSLWGAPIAVRRAGEYTYLFFRNGCEHRCGTEDVVTLDNGQVVNAVVRWPGHNFLGAPATPTAPPAPPLVPATDSVKGTVSPPPPPPPDSGHAPGTQ